MSAYMLAAAWLVLVAAVILTIHYADRYVSRRRSL